MSEVSDSDFSWHPSKTEDESDHDSYTSDESTADEFNLDSDDSVESDLHVEFDMLDTVFENDCDVDASVDWSSTLQPVCVDEFVGQSGPCHSLNVEFSTEIDFFHLYFSCDTVRSICSETNRYAATFHDSLWYDVTEAEMESFLALLIMMGIVKLPSYKLYWSHDSFLNNQGFVNVMPCRRFAKILQYLHINDIDNGTDPLSKLRPLLTDTLNNIKANYAPNKHLSVDEGMVAFKGRHSAVQYNPSKPIKRGLKVWMLCDSQSGFCHNFQVYMGKVLEGDSGPHGLGFKVVKELTADIKRKNHQVFFDSYFTSIPLLLSLKSDGLYGCGTVKANRKGLPQEFRNLPKLNLGESCVAQSGQLTAYVWQDKRPVTVLSTNANPLQDVPASRRQSDGSRIQVPRPGAIALYQQHYRGVDKCDQLRAAYPVGRSSRKWWRYIFHFIINICVINAFITLKESVPRGHQWANKRYCQLDFRLNLVKQLVSGFQHKGRSRGGVLPLSSFTLHEHRWVRLPRRRSTCKFCSSKMGVRKETVYGCISCNLHFCTLAHHTAFHQQGRHQVQDHEQ